MKRRRQTLYLSGRDFEEKILGNHEMQSFPINRDSSFSANFVNVVLAQPKDHDPNHPVDPWLVEMKKGIEKFLASRVSLYICVGLPIDILDSTDLLVVSWDKKSFVTIDLTTFVDGPSRADLKFTPNDTAIDTLPNFCEAVALKIDMNPNRIRPDMFELLNKFGTPGGTG